MPLYAGKEEEKGGKKKRESGDEEAAQYSHSTLQMELNHKEPQQE